ncbi:MAG: CCA tRNA nucleotidyltransferase [Lachnospiraceae bacterium]|nr:CCA tRNA nucleotidyltransferase [Lachnospiraceae bacterium]
MEIQIPDKVDYILNELHANGYEAYAVGGCVRDALLGREPEDWDITTSAKPQQVKELFKRTIDTGIQHGTVTIMLDKDGFEVTTYRIDGSYEDGRHPTEVEFTSDLLEDLRRRDFTINAMAYNKEEGVVDAFDGMGDLKRHIIKCVGNPRERFDEDALRILRAVRFGAQLDFDIEEETRAAVKELVPTLQKISAERIRVELDKLLCSNHPERLMIAKELGITKVVLPEFDEMVETAQNHPHHCFDVGMHSLKAVEHTLAAAKKAGLSKKDYSVMAWTALLHDVGKPDCLTVDEEGITHFYKHPAVSKEKAKKILKRLRFDNYTIDLACHLIQYHDVEFSSQKNKMRKLMNKIGVEEMKYLFLLMEGDVLAQSDYKRQEKMDKLQASKALYHEICDAEECVTLKMLAINGGDLLREGFPKGKSMGEILNGLLEAVIEEPKLNEKDTLISLAKEKYGHFML